MQVSIKNESRRKPIIKGRWVFKLKSGADRMPVRSNARWDIKGYIRQKVIDYDDINAAVTKATTLKLLIAMIAHYDLEAKQYNIMKFFLYAEINDHETFVEQPYELEKTC